MDRLTCIHNSIRDFVMELNKIYPNDKPLALYNRLIKSPPKNLKDTVVEKHIKSFSNFFNTYGNLILDQNKTPKDAKIRFNNSEKIFINVSKFLVKSDNGTKNIIKQHLLAIRTMINPSTKEIEKLEGTLEKLNIDTSTREGEFIYDILSDARDAVENTESDSPIEAMGKLLTSGLIQKMVGGIHESIISNDMDMNKLFSTMQSVMGELLNQQKEQPVSNVIIDEVEDTATIDNSNVNTTIITEDTTNIDATTEDDTNINKKIGNVD